MAPLSEPIDVISESQIDGFRQHLHEHWSGQSGWFRARYPSFESFGAWELKYFLMLNPEREVPGIDPVSFTGDGVVPTSRLEWWAWASRRPDDDPERSTPR